MSSTGSKFSAGLTLVEVMISVVILSGGLIAVGRAYMISIGALGIGRENTEAFCLLKQKMGEIEEQALEQQGLLPGASRGGFEGNFSNYEWSTDVKQVAEKLSEVDLTVQRKGSLRIFSLATYADAKE